MNFVRLWSKESFNKIIKSVKGRLFIPFSTSHGRPMNQRPYRRQEGNMTHLRAVAVTNSISTMGHEFNTHIWQMLFFTSDLHLTLFLKLLSLPGWVN